MNWRSLSITLALAIGAWSIGVQGLSALAAQAAQPAAASEVTKYFEVGKPSTISGMVGGISHTTKSPYVMLALAVKEDDGNRKMKWVVKGDTRSALEKAGWSFGPNGTLALGTTVSIKAFPLKEGANALEVIRGAGPEMMSVAKAGSVWHGVEVILPNGKKMYFGPAE
jgi:hypothetical protein